MESFALQRTQRAKLVAKPLAALTAGGPGYGSHMGTARRPRGRLLALEQAQAGFKLLEVVVTLAWVMMFSARMNCFMRPDIVPRDMLAQASSRARKPPRVITGDKSGT